MAATLQRKCSGGINFVIITKIITKITVPRNYFVMITARMVCLPCVSQCFWESTGGWGQQNCPQKVPSRQKSIHAAACFLGDFSRCSHLQFVIL